MQGLEWLFRELELLYRQWGAMEGLGAEELQDEC